MGGNRFELMIGALASSAVPGFKAAVIGVTEAAQASKLWFETNGIAASAADIVAMTQIMVEYHIHLQRQEDIKAIEAQLEQDDQDITDREE